MTKMKQLVFEVWLRHVRNHETEEGYVTAPNLAEAAALVGKYVEKRPFVVESVFQKTTDFLIISENKEGSEPLSNTTLTLRAQSILKGEGITTVPELQAYYKDNRLLDIPNMGAETLRELHNFLRSIN